MLRVKPLQISRSLPAAGSVPGPAPTPASRSITAEFITAEDFDDTGIMTGVDPCNPRYWWMPELHALEERAGGSAVPPDGPTDPGQLDQATSRGATRPPAAA